MVKRIKDLSIGTKISSSFTVLIILSIIMVFVGYSSLKLISHKVKISEEANNIAELILDMRIKEVKFMRTGDKNRDKEINDLLDKAINRIESLEKKVDKQIEREEINQIKELITNFKISFNNYAKSTYQQQDYRRTFVKEEEELIEPLYSLSRLQNQALGEFIKEGKLLSDIERKRENIMIIENIIRFINEIGKQERNLVINFANDQKEKEYINQTLSYFDKAKEELVNGIFKEEMNSDQVEELLAALKDGRDAFNDVVITELTKNQQKKAMVELGDKVVTKAKELSENKEIEIKESVKSGIEHLIIISIVGIIIGIIFSIVITKAVSKPVLSVMKFLKEMAQNGGDLTKRIAVDSQDEVGRLSYWFNAFVDQLHDIILKLRDDSEELSAYSEELSSSSEEGSAGIEDTRRLIEGMVAHIQQISASAQEVTGYAQQTSAQTEFGNRNIEETIGSIQGINQAVERAVKSIANLEVNSEEIGKIIELITSIAEQTNLLALNAAIEAARAGEHGMGFSVVADEIRSLAEETAKATQDISALINNIQKQTKDSIEMIRKVERKANEGERIAQKTSSVFEEIKVASEQTSAHIEDTAQSTQQLVADTDQIMISAEDIERMSTELSSSSQELSGMAESLQSLISKFKI